LESFRHRSPPQEFPVLESRSTRAARKNHSSRLRSMMMPRLFLAPITLAAVGLAFVAPVSVAVAGELDTRRLKDEPGSLPETALPARGAGQLSLIRGELEGNPIEGNLEDVFVIRIVDVEAFSARTVRPAGAASLQTHLWLFTVCGAPLLGNLVDPTAPPAGGGALLLPAANDGSGVTIDEPGLYLLAVSAGSARGAGRVPVGADGPLFSIGSATEISGPDGSAGAQTLAGWTGNGTIGEYKIELTGCAFLGTGFADLDGSGEVDGADLGLLLAMWGPANDVGAQLADLNGDGVIDGSDLGLMLAYWGASLLPSHCGDELAGDCSDPGPAPYCADVCCCTQICAIDPRCCVVAWDGICAAFAAELCGN